MTLYQNSAATRRGPDNFGGVNVNESLSRPATCLGRSLIGPTLLLLLLLSVALVGCSGGPTTQAEVCSSYDSLADELDSGQVTGLFDGHIYDAIKDLGGTASRYEADSNISEAGDVMKDLAKQEQISMLELMGAAAPFDAFCS